jgi:hypothetical protein
MFKTLISILLIGLVAVGAHAAPARASQTNDDAASKVQKKVARIGIGEKAKVTVRMKSGTKIKGFIAQAGANDFTVRNKQTGDVTSILYSDVLKVEDNRGLSRSKNLALGIGLGVAAFIAVGALIFASTEH